MVWYTERGAEMKGYQWLTNALRKTARALIEIKKHYGQVAKSDTGWILTEYGIKLKPGTLAPWSKVVELMRKT
jgi:hypothetical protein